MYRNIELPADVPAQVRSWNMDYNREVEKYNALVRKGAGPAVLMSQAERVEAAGTKVTRYLLAVRANGGKVIQPPVTDVERAVAQTKSAPAFTKLAYRSSY